MAGVALADPRKQFLDTDGNPLSGGFVHVYLAGTTTETNSWQDRAQTTLNTNPIVLDAAGACQIVLDTALTYKLVVTDSAGVTQPHLGADNVVGAAGASVLADAIADIEAQEATSIAAVAAQQTTSVTAVQTAQSTAESAIDLLVTDAETAETNAEAAAATAQLLIATQRFATKALMDADLAHAAGTFAAVYADSTVANNTIYYKVGASGAGSWTAYKGSWVERAPLTNAIYGAKSATKWNLYDPDTATAGTLISSTTGATSANASFFATDYMTVKGGNTYKSSPARGGLGASFGIAWYDKDQTYISGVGGTTTDGQTYVAPANACFMRMCAANALASTLIVLPNEITLGSYASHAPGSKADDATTAATALFAAVRSRTSVQVNLYDKLTRNVGSIPQITTLNGALSAVAGFDSTDYIPVEAGQAYEVGPASSGLSSPYGVAWYDKDRTFLSGTAAPFTDGQSFTAPASACFMRVPFKDTQVDTFRVVDGRSTYSTNIFGHTPALKSDVRPWYGKTIMALGDSLTAQYNWMGIDVAAYLGCTVVRHSASGRVVADLLKTSGGVALAEADFDAVNAVQIFIGVNDKSLNTTLGAIGDSTATASFYGYYKKHIEQILTWNPSLRLVLCTLLHYDDARVANAQGYDSDDYSAAIRAMANYYSLPLIDFAYESGFNDQTIGTFTTDGQHPATTSAGYVPITNLVKAAWNHRILPVA